MKNPKIKTILVPVDFSKLSGLSIATAKELARRFGATVHFAHVHEFYTPGFTAPLPLSIMAYRDDSAARSTRRLKMLAKKNGFAPENCHFMDGAPTFHEICHLARQIAADLIVMPTHGFTGLTRMLAGSTAERIVQHSPCPVLITPGGKRAKRIWLDGETASTINNILVPVDFSQCSFRALEYAIDFAEQVAARLIAFHVVQLGQAFAADGYAMYDLSPLIDAARKSAEEQMAQFLRLAKFRRVAFESAVHIGPSASEICDFAREREVDLIITATHGLTGFKHLLIGSVAERVVRHADRPVLVVPSHPDVRTATLTGEVRRSTQRPNGRPRIAPAVRVSVLKKRERKLAAHPFPERRRINKFRESHLSRPH